MKIVVVGAGVAGLGTALMMGRAGHRVTLPGAATGPSRSELLDAMAATAGSPRAAG